MSATTRILNEEETLMLSSDMDITQYHRHALGKAIALSGGFRDATSIFMSNSLGRSLVLALGRVLVL